MGDMVATRGQLATQLRRVGIPAEVMLENMHGPSGQRTLDEERASLSVRFSTDGNCDPLRTVRRIVTCV